MICEREIHIHREREREREREGERESERERERERELAFNIANRFRVYRGKLHACAKKVNVRSLSRLLDMTVVENIAISESFEF